MASCFLALALLLLLAVAQGALPVSTFTLEDVPLGDVNIVAVTDVHSWLQGGDQQDQQEDQRGQRALSNRPRAHALDANFGDLISFTQRLKTHAAAQGKDVFLVDNGDVVDGTGLSNLFKDHCSALLPLLRRVPFDALNCGNHELYTNATMEAFRSR